MTGAKANAAVLALRLVSRRILQADQIQILTDLGYYCFADGFGADDVQIFAADQGQVVLGFQAAALMGGAGFVFLAAAFADAAEEALADAAAKGPGGGFGVVFAGILVLGCAEVDVADGLDANVLGGDLDGGEVGISLGGVDGDRAAGRQV